jgi:two-component system chemotaxis sensor kinase CheA
LSSFSGFGGGGGGAAHTKKKNSPKAQKAATKKKKEKIKKENAEKKEIEAFEAESIVENDDDENLEVKEEKREAITKQDRSEIDKHKTGEKNKKIREIKTKNQTMSIRVDTRRVDNLMNLVSELVTGRNRIVQVGKQFKSEELNESLSFIEKLVSDLQSSVMKIRMVPLEKVFSRFPRIVRDLKKTLGKEIKFEITGQETELDRVVSDEIYDPLMHMIRNAVDHGIEMPDVREVAGKSREGKIELTARQEDNFVYIEIIDDGKGIDYEVIARKAIENELLSEEEIEKLSEYDIINLIFKPGFSTAKTLSEISGRGVGMDVVKSSIEKLGGIVDIITEKGKGSRFRIRLPLTLAIMHVLIIEVSDRKYAIPLNSVVETIRIDKSEIQTISGEELVFLRGKTLPIVYLSSVFDVEEYEKESEKLNVVVLGLGNNKVGLVIDDMFGKQEIVIKPLGKYLGKVKGISGTTLLGDGNIIMIIDSNLIVSEGRSLSNSTNKVLKKKKLKVGNKILYVEDSKNMQKIGKRILENNGYIVELANDGIEGIEKIQKTKYNLVITDYNMPNMDGYEFLSKMRKIKSYEEVPVVLISSEWIDISDSKWRELDVVDYIKKPFEEKKIVSLINNIFKEG